MSSWFYHHDGRFETLGCWVCRDYQDDGTAFLLVCDMGELGWQLNSVSEPLCTGAKYFEFYR